MTAPPRPGPGAPVAPGALDAGEIDAVAAARGLAPEDLAFRLRADASSRTTVLALYGLAIA